MSLKDDLIAEVKSTFSSVWEEQTTTSVPAPENLRLNANHAKDLETATVLYADLDASTNMVDGYSWPFSAEVYKTYLRCAGQIIRSEGGTITSYDGDRIMAIYTGGSKNTSAVRAALKINWAVHNIIRPALKKYYSSTQYVLNHVVGVDTSQLRAARIGVKGDNDIVWIGRAANHKAKLTTLSQKPLWITKAVYDKINEEVKISNGAQMWEKRLWTSMNNAEIYCSTYTYILK
jgi:class 3 adenylate cyclase